MVDNNLKRREIAGESAAARAIEVRIAVQGQSCAGLAASHSAVTRMLWIELAEVRAKLLDAQGSARSAWIYSQRSLSGALHVSSQPYESAPSASRSASTHGGAINLEFAGPHLDRRRRCYA